jgi:hydrogenase maturation protein HypF
MTSGNLSEEPIAIGNEEAQTRLAVLADAFLLHDRPIHIACDDSVVAYAPPIPRLSLPASHSAYPDAAPHVIPIRRSRGYAPMPIALPFPIAPVLAVGGELKNTLCVARDNYAFLSGHIGDLANLETQRAFEQAEEHMRRLFRVTPARITCDLHPGYLSTHWAETYAQRAAIPLVRVQHHHAHVSALMVEHQLPIESEIIGVAMDGTGYGSDATVWGGEFMVAGYANFRRVGRLRPLPLPGGDASIRRPYRMALAALWAFGMAWDEWLPPVAACPPAEQRLLIQQLERNFNCVPTSSMGRLFDALAALMGLCATASYEAQGAIHLETLAHAVAATDASSVYAAYPVRCYALAKRSDLRCTVDGDTHAPNLGQTDQDRVEFELDPEPLVRAVTTVLTEIQSRPRHRSAQQRQLQDTDALAHVAYRVHESVSAMIETGCQEVRRRYGHEQVGLTGGVFQNALLLELTAARLARAGFQVLTHRLVPPNDGGLALGQAVVAGCRAAAGMLG